MLRCQALTVGVPGRVLVEALDLELRPGEFVAVLGQNGAGKTLTLKTLAGLRPPDGGAVTVDDRSLGEYPRRRLARRLAMLPQETDDAFPSTVEDTALIGRHPYVGLLGVESAEDRQKCLSALERVDLETLRERDVHTLSGGERRRLAVAQILTQDPECYLLDEPLNHLDPRHQIAILDLFRGLANEGRSVIASLHDANLAARYADRVLVLFGDGRWQSGSVAGTLDAALLCDLYGVTIDVVPWRGGQVFVPASGADPDVRPARD